jgi:leader peptidase (prepilin peptidase)/N-methyltransferase
MLLLEYFQAEPGSFTLAVGLLGLIVGSFLNVVILRLPVMMDREWQTQCAEVLDTPEKEKAPAQPERFDLVVPRSRCPSCGHPVTALQNIPVVSYLFLRGRCAVCRTKISIRYPVVEILCGILSAAVAWHFGVSFAALGALLLTWALVALTFIDFDHQLLPDSITLPFLWLGLAFNLFATYTDSASSLIGAMAGYGALWSVYHVFKLLTGKEGMGYGDFKLLAMLGAWMGWQALPAVILISSLVGAIVGIALILLRGHDRNIPIPFGPYIATAGWITLLWGSELTDLYLQWSGLG